ncbi:hypothetical protein EV356DRAFT_535189 [Viridothelium virens]|uniref:Uncharacterized protein n=1 Tax=Viridothelium virens TaxID=1048519 RepID=A0A6A6H1U4_VIRVR|nr:hypothetical protein EV356DRAFT_535189 [Viridothelium virens]
MKLLNIFLICSTGSFATAKSQSTIVDTNRLMSQSTNRQTYLEQFYQCSSTFITDSERMEECADSLSHDLPVLTRDLELHMMQDHSRTWAVVVAEQVSTLIDEVKQMLSEVKISKVPSDALAWVQAHPTQAASYAIWAGYVFTLSFPAWVNCPLLSTVGLSAEGPKARSIAAIAQSKMTRVVAKGVFAHLQGAQMGGYGVGPVNMGTRVSIAVSDLASYFSARNWRDGFASSVDHPKLVAPEHSTESS